MGNAKKKFDKEDYAKKLKDPRWQKRRLEVLQRDDWKCQACDDDQSPLHVHHLTYQSSEPWDTSEKYLITLCEACHEQESLERYSEEKRLLRELKKIGLLTGDLQSMAEHFAKANEYFDRLDNEGWAGRESQLIQSARSKELYHCAVCYSEETLNIHHKQVHSFENPIDLPDQDFEFICDQCRGKKFNRLSWEWELILLQEMREAGFYSNDLLALAQAFSRLKLPLPSEVFTSMLCSILEDDEFQDIVREKYFQFLQLKNSQEKLHL